MIKYEVKVPQTATDLTEKEEVFKFKLNKIMLERGFKNKNELYNVISEAIAFYGMSSLLIAFPASNGILKINRKFTSKTIIELKPINN